MSAHVSCVLDCAVFVGATLLPLTHNPNLLDYIMLKSYVSRLD